MAIFGKPQYSTVTVKKKDIPKDVWTKCPKTNEIIYNRVLKENLMVVPNSDYHFPLDARTRIASLLDEDSFVESDQQIQSLDPLNFTATAKYKEKLKQNQKKTNETDTVICGRGTIQGQPVHIAVMDFQFHGGQPRLSRWRKKSPARLKTDARRRNQSLLSLHRAEHGCKKGFLV